MRLLQIIIITVLLTTGLAYSQEKVKPSVNWISFEQLEDSLQTNPKPVLLFFHTDWCSYCKKMLRETFTAPEVIEMLNSHYYAVEFDAESVDSIQFDGQIFKNDSPIKRTGKYHELAKILMGSENRAIFPTTMLLNEDFSVKKKKNNYLSIKQILNIL